MDDVQALTGMLSGLDDILASLDLPPTTGISNQLGLSGIEDGATSDLFAGFGGDGAIGHGEGDDFEDEVAKELRDEDALGYGEEDMDTDVKMENITPQAPLRGLREDYDDGLMDEDDDLFGAPEPPRKRRRVQKAERAYQTRKPHNVHDLFPSFEPGKILNFTDIFKGRVLHKSRVKHRPIRGEHPLVLADSFIDPILTTSSYS